MENGLVMSQELKQKQTLSAYQYQSLHILHLGNAQVGELLKKEYLENPFIEQREGFSGEEYQWLEYYKSNMKEDRAVAGPGGGPEARDTDEDAVKELPTSWCDWRMDIKEQLYDGRTPAAQRRLLEQMILLLDDHGFLAFSEAEGSGLLKIPVKQYRALRKQLMELEPEGIGCVSMGEYFLFQLMKKGIHVPDAFRDLCMNHLEDITEMTFIQIAHKIHASFQEVKRWVRVLGTLEPYPIRDSGMGSAAETVIPDILIVPRGGELEVRVNDYYTRQYCVSDFYRRTIKDEDNAELQIQGIANLVRLECRQANIEKSQEITIGDLLKTCLRMRPSRIIVGEVRSKEAAELLQVVNVGNDGSLSTIHANSCKDMISRLETMVLMGMELPIPVIRRQIVSGFDIFVHLGRMKDKSRKVQEISEIDRIEAGEVILNPLYVRTSGLEKTGEMIHREKCRKAGIML